MYASTHKKPVRGKGQVSEVTAHGSGVVVPVRAGDRLAVIVTSPTVHTASTFLSDELVNVSGFRTFRHVAWAGQLEDLSTFGVRAQLPFRAFLDGSGGARVGAGLLHPLVRSGRRWPRPL